MDFNITETPTKAKGTMRLIAPYLHAQVMWRLGISQSRFIKTLYKYKDLDIESIYLMLKLSLEFRLLENQPAFKASLA